MLASSCHRPRSGIRKINSVRALLCLVAMVAAVAACPLAHGSPDKGDIIDISTIDDLQQIGEDASFPLDGNYRLTGPLNASATASWNGGAGFVPLGTNDAPFTGELDGQGFIITGLHIDREDTSDVGLIGVAASGAVIRDLTLRNAFVRGAERTGALVGSLSEFALVTGCSASGDVLGSLNVGGLVGVNEGEIALSSARVDVMGEFSVGGLVGSNLGEIATSFARGRVTGDSSVGGLVGANSAQATIADSYATASIADGAFLGIGALVGVNDGTVIRTYGAGKVGSVGAQVRGGLIGQNAGPVTASFWDVTTTGLADSAGGSGLPSNVMTQRTVFGNAGWNFSAIWRIDAGLSYPYLQDNVQDPPPAPGNTGEGEGEGEGEAEGEGAGQSEGEEEGEGEGQTEGEEEGEGEGEAEGEVEGEGEGEDDEELPFGCACIPTETAPEGLGKFLGEWIVLALGTVAFVGTRRRWGP